MANVIVSQNNFESLVSVKREHQGRSSSPRCLKGIRWYNPFRGNSFTVSNISRRRHIVKQETIKIAEWWKSTQSILLLSLVLFALNSMQNFMVPLHKEITIYFPHNSEAVFVLCVVDLSLVAYRQPCFSEIKTAHPLLSKPSLNHQLSTQCSSGVHLTRGMEKWGQGNQLSLVAQAPHHSEQARLQHTLGKAQKRAER